MAAQRIVLTSPWKLGLFVFMLVAGTGFGLIWTYIEVFGGQVDLRDEKVLQMAYAVLGGVAALGLLGYIAVVSSARPLDRVVRNSRQRETLLKRFGKIQDPRMVDIDEFEDEPALKAILERWGEQASEASEVKLTHASRTDALSKLTEQLRESAAEDFHPEFEDDAAELDALVDAIKGFAATAGGHTATAQEFASSRGPVPSGPRAPFDDERSTWHAAAEQLFRCEQELEGFVRSVADHAGQIAQRTEGLTRQSGSLPREAAVAVDTLRRNATRLGKIKEASDLLAAEAGRIADKLAAAGEGGQKLAESLRTLAGQYQRIGTEIGAAGEDQDEGLNRLLGMEVATLDSAAANALAQQAMALDQHAEALAELLARFRNPMQQIRDLAPEIAAAVPPAPSAPSRPVAAPSAPVATDDEPAADFGTNGQSGAVETADDERIYEIAELGGRELAAASGDEGAAGEDRVYDLEELGAVEL